MAIGMARRAFLHTPNILKTHIHWQDVPNIPKYYERNFGLPLPEEAAVTKEGVKIVVPAEKFSDFGETPD